MSLLIATGLYIIFCVIFLYVVFGGFLYGAMWMKLPAKHVERMLRLAKLQKGSRIFDLGAGYGNIAFKAAEHNVEVVAVEADPFKAKWLSRQIKQKNLANVTCIQGNLLDVDLSQADVLLCYLGDGLMNKIATKELKSGCTIVSCCHKIKGWTPTLIDKNYTYPIYVYTVK